MPCFIDCKIRGTGHWTIDIDVDDLGEFDADSGYVVKPTNKQISDGYLDTAYAFFDMTFDSSIGDRTERIENVNIYDVGYFGHRRDTITEKEPNY